jgi:predicted LPLAT superfamily acyltransferase
VNVCLLIPIYDHGSTIRRVVESLAPLGLPCLVVDDGSGEQTRAEIDRVAEDHPWIRVHRRAVNGGKGAAVQTGYRVAAGLGYTHVIQLDADAQHDAADVPEFLAALRRNPDALVCGDPAFDESIPPIRLYGRQLSRGLVWLSTLSLEIRDPLCGYRAVPLATALSVMDRGRVGRQMDFDPDMAVRMFWAGAPIDNVRTRVIYPEGGISHFRMIRDNARMLWLYLRLVAGMVPRSPKLLLRAARRWRGASAAGSRKRDWAAKGEHGSVTALRVMARIYETVGRRACIPIVHAVAAYFFVTDRQSRRASRAYLETLYATPEGRKALGRPPGWRDVYRHVFEFAMNIFDRLVVFGSDVEQMRFSHQGSELLFSLAREKRGAILLGSHMGSFDMLRTVADAHGLKVNILMFTEHAQHIQSFFEQLDPDSHVRVLAYDPSWVRTAFEIRACLARGEFVGILADRLAPGGRERSALSPFLGRPAAFPLGPFLLSVVLGCPLLVSVSVRTADAAYDLMTRPLDMEPKAPAREREKRARELLDAYVRVLEEYCYRKPHQWMNFYDFWAPPEKADR